MYVHGIQSYGSCDGCDSWIMTDDGDKELLTQRMFGELSITHNVWEVEFGEYCDRNVLRAWNTFIDGLGFAAKFVAYNEACLKRREEERLEREQERLARQKALEEQRLEREAEEAALAVADGVRDVEELVAFFRAGPSGDPFFREKLAARTRRLVRAASIARGHLREDTARDLEWVESEYGLP
jgi:uncharacterized protein YhaN